MLHDSSVRLALALNLLLMLLMLATCSPAQRSKWIDLTASSLDTSSKIFVEYDLKKKNSIVDEAKTEVEARTELDHYYRRRQRVVELFVIAYRALATAAILNDSQSIEAMLAAFNQLEPMLKVFLEGGEP